MTVLQELIEIIKDKRKESDISNTLLRFCQVEAEKLLKKEQDIAINFVQYLREKDVVCISQKQINLLTSGKKIKSFSEHLTDFNEMLSAYENVATCV